MEALKNLQTDPSNNFDEALKVILTNDLHVFKSTKGRFLNNNQKRFQNCHLVA